MTISEIALLDVGYLEKASNKDLNDKTTNAGRNNYTKYGAWYGNNGVAWCAQAVSYWADLCGHIKAGVIPMHQSCTKGIEWFKARGQWHGRTGYTPQVDDIIYFQNPKGDRHVGIVYKVDSEFVYTVEGNTSNAAEMVANGGCVAKKRYSHASAYILGYAHPAYPQKEDKDLTESEVRKIVREEIDKSDPRYKSIEDVPENLQAETRALLDCGAINGGTDAEVNPNDVNMRKSALKAVIIAKRYTDAKK